MSGYSIWDVNGYLLQDEISDENEAKTIAQDTANSLNETVILAKSGDDITRINLRTHFRPNQKPEKDHN
jgi:hypothetical protein